MKAPPVRAALVAFALLLSPSAPAEIVLCPEGMAFIDERTCIDRYEAALVLVGDAGAEEVLFPHNQEVKGQPVRALSRASVFPQGHISRDEAEAACEASGKRLCRAAEWTKACEGTTPTLYPYGPRYRSGHCDDEGVSSLNLLYGSAPARDYRIMNDPRLGTMAGTVARAGDFARCDSGYGVFDLVGNLHEWTAEPEGVFRGGYFLDTRVLGEGCRYATSGHAPTYRDYATGFRCCADPAR